MLRGERIGGDSEKSERRIIARIGREASGKKHGKLQQLGGIQSIMGLRIA
jgi:hypothetical protein